MAEKLGSGLQNRSQQCDSAPDLKAKLNLYGIIMTNILDYSQIVAAILLIASILLQHRGTSLGGAFGGEGNVYRSRRGAEKFLFYLTIGLAIIFVGIAIANILIQRNN